MNEILKLGFRLFLFSLIAAAALAVTNEVTKGPIAEQKMAAKRAALETVLPNCEYEPIEYEGLADGSNLDEIFVAKNANGDVEGYALTASPNGYGGEIPITMGVHTGGYVTQVYVGSLSETAGLGSRVGDAPFKEQFIGIAADPDTLRSDVDLISGASVSSGAFLNAAEEALTYTKNTLGIEPHAGDKDAILAMSAGSGAEEETAASDQNAETTGAKKYDVNGFQPFTVEIALDGEGKIVSVSVPEHNETPGLGADLIADASVFESLVGKDVKDAQIDVKAGVTLTSNAINDALKQAAESLNSAAGGVKKYDVTGFQPFTVAVETDAENKIVSVSVPEHNETPGLGADLIADAAVFDALVGKSVNEAQIDVKAGVTLTSNAINEALKKAAEDSVSGEAAAEMPVIPGDPYTVKGMNKFTVYIEAEDGKIASITVPEHNETPGLGADILTEDALSALIGADLSDAKVDVKAGVTLTSNAVNAALERAAEANGIVRNTSEPAAEQPEEQATQDASEEIVEGSAKKSYRVNGFQPFTVEIETDAANKIVSVTVPSHNETPGLGADLLADASVFEALVGQDIKDAQIDVKAGVTLTSNAVNDALKQAAASVQDSSDSSAGVKKEYEVTGFQPFTVEIETDAENKIISVTVPSHTETPGLGADLLADASVFEALVGQDIKDAQIDVKAGVTLTSNAVNEALKQAAGEAK